MIKYDFWFSNLSVWVESNISSQANALKSDFVIHVGHYLLEQ